MFEESDKDHDGQLSFEEFKHASALAGHPMSEEEASSEFDELSFGTYTNMDSFGCVNWRGVFCEFAEFADFCVWCAHMRTDTLNSSRSSTA